MEFSSKKRSVFSVPQRLIKSLVTICKDCVYLHNFILCTAEDAINPANSTSVYFTRESSGRLYNFNLYLVITLIFLEFISDKLLKRKAG